MYLAKWLQTATSTTKLTHSTILARLVRARTFIKNAPRFVRRSIEILDLLPLSTTTSTIFSYSYLGEISLLRDDFDTGLTHFMHLINNFSENLPLKVFLRVSAIHLVKVSERSERALKKTRILAINPAKWLQT